MKSLLLAAAGLVPLLATASPLVERAGGPAIKPIPKTCTVINPLPHAACGTANVNGFMPDPDFVTANLLYQAYFDNSGSAKEQAKQCKEQCYGYGNPGECKSSFVGFKIPVPAGYLGTDGGQLEIGCLLFSEYLDPTTFVASPKGQYQKATAANIYCPS